MQHNEEPITTVVMANKETMPLINSIFKEIQALAKQMALVLSLLGTPLDPSPKDPKRKARDVSADPISRNKEIITILISIHAQIKKTFVSEADSKTKQALENFLFAATIEYLKQLYEKIETYSNPDETKQISFFAINANMLEETLQQLAEQQDEFFRQICKKMQHVRRGIRAKQIEKAEDRAPSEKAKLEKNTMPENKLQIQFEPVVNIIERRISSNVNINKVIQELFGTPLQEPDAYLENLTKAIAELNKDTCENNTDIIFNFYKALRQHFLSQKNYPGIKSLKAFLSSAQSEYQPVAIQLSLDIFDLFIQGKISSTEDKDFAPLYFAMNGSFLDLSELNLIDLSGYENFKEQYTNHYFSIKRSIPELLADIQKNSTSIIDNTNPPDRFNEVISMTTGLMNGFFLLKSLLSKDNKNEKAEIEMTKMVEKHIDILKQRTRTPNSKDTMNTATVSLSTIHETALKYASGRNKVVSEYWEMIAARTNTKNSEPEKSPSAASSSSSSASSAGSSSSNSSNLSKFDIDDSSLVKSNPVEKSSAKASKTVNSIAKACFESIKSLSNETEIMHHIRSSLAEIQAIDAKNDEVNPFAFFNALMDHVSTIENSTVISAAIEYIQNFSASFNSHLDSFSLVAPEDSEITHQVFPYPASAPVIKKPSSKSKPEPRTQMSREKPAAPLQPNKESSKNSSSVPKGFTPEELEADSAEVRARKQVREKNKNQNPAANVGAAKGAQNKKDKNQEQSNDTLAQKSEAQTLQAAPPENQPNFVASTDTQTEEQRKQKKIAGKRKKQVNSLTQGNTPERQQEKTDSNSATTLSSSSASAYSLDSSSSSNISSSSIVRSKTSLPAQKQAALQNNNNLTNSIESKTIQDSNSNTDPRSSAAEQQVIEAQVEQQITLSEVETVSAANPSVAELIPEVPESFAKGAESSSNDISVNMITGAPQVTASSLPLSPEVSSPTSTASATPANTSTNAFELPSAPSESLPTQHLVLNSQSMAYDRVTVATIMIQNEIAISQWALSLILESQNECKTIKQEYQQQLERCTQRHAQELAQQQQAHEEALHMLRQEYDRKLEEYAAGIPKDSKQAYTDGFNDAQQLRLNTLVEHSTVSGFLTTQAYQTGFEAGLAVFAKISPTIAAIDMRNTNIQRLQSRTRRHSAPPILPSKPEAAQADSNKSTQPTAKPEAAEANANKEKTISKSVRFLPQNDSASATSAAGSKNGSTPPAASIGDLSARPPASPAFLVASGEANSSTGSGTSKPILPSQQNGRSGRPGSAADSKFNWSP